MTTTTKQLPYHTTITTVPTLSYAHALNDIPFIRRIEIKGDKKANFTEAQLRVSVTSIHGDLFEPMTMIIPQCKELIQFNEDAFETSGALHITFTQEQLKKLLLIDSITPCHVVVDLYDKETLIAHGEHALVIVPARTWSYVVGNHKLTANLCVNILHYHSCIVEVIERAKTYFQQQGMNASFHAYQGDAESVDRQVKAIYNAVLTYKLGYIMPPTSWEMNNVVTEVDGYRMAGGQLVRTPEQVLSQGVGTCLDTTVLLAAVLEAVGIRPLIVLLPRHALIGYWRQEKSLPDVVVRLNESLNYIDSAMIGVVETTLLSHTEVNFEQAVDSAKKSVSKQESVKDDYSCLIDVRMARIMYNIRPLPTLQDNQDGSVEVVYPPAVNYTINVANDTKKSVHYDSERDMPERVAFWRSQLLDLSMSNRLINFRIEKSRYVQIPIAKDTLANFEDVLNTRQIVLRAYADDAEYKRFDDYLLTQGESPVNLAGVLANSSAVYVHIAPNSYLSVMRKMYKVAKNVIEQTGVNQLYLALGSLIWSSDATRKPQNTSENTNDETFVVDDTAEHKTVPSQMRANEVRSPLILVPITIAPVRQADTYAITLDTSSPVMPNYTLIEKLSRELRFELPELRLPPEDNAGIDVQRLFADIRRRIAEEDRPFRLDEICAIGFFDFGNYRLWRDMGDNWQRYTNNSLIKHMVYSANTLFAQHGGSDALDLDDLQSRLPLMADDSQVDAISLALTKTSFVLQGPPGTGKSQTIANMICAALEQGKRVLFVTDKKTAADVVYDRLVAMKGQHQPFGIETFVLNIHDQDAKPESVKRQIARVIDLDYEIDDVGYEINRRKYDMHVRPLAQYPKQLHALSKYGYSAYSAREKMLALASVPEVEISPLFVRTRTAQDISTVLDIIQQTQDVALSLGRLQANPWLCVGRSVTLTDELKTQLVSRVDVAQSILMRMDPAVLQMVTNLPIKTRQDVHVLRILLNQKLHATGNSPADELRTCQQIKSLIDEIHGVREAYRNRTISTSEAERKYNDITARLVRSVNAYKRIQMPANWTPQNSMHEQLLVTQIQAVMTELQTHLESTQTVAEEIKQFVQDVAQVQAQHVVELVSSIDAILTTVQADDDSIQLWCQQVPLGVWMCDALPNMHADQLNGFIQLSRWMDFTAKLQVLSQFQLSAFVDGLYWGTIPYLQAFEVFERSLLNAIYARLMEEEGLASFDEHSHEVRIKEYAVASTLLQQHAYGRVMAGLLQRRNQSMQLLQAEVQQLGRELAKMQRPMKVRQLLSQHAQIIQGLMPCTIASPNSIAMLLDVGQQPYDLVIFDEASQIRVPHAICGIGRADAAVIVGDSRQMPPTSVAEKLYLDDVIEDELAVDEESILTECVAMQLPTKTLTWHYRSSNEMLISFSNTAYYDGKLSAFPSPVSTQTTQPAITFVPVNGTYIRRAVDTQDPSTTTTKRRRTAMGERSNTNPIEAAAVYAHLTQLVNDPAYARKSIGILTLNEKQAELIESYILASDGDGNTRQRYEGDDPQARCFVKNLESIQGDEADIILFSIGFSRNEQGIVPLNFGPLNRIGGERRLNVAITRAREHITVFCSFEPEELRAEESISRGIRDLRDYLMLAKHGAEASNKMSMRKSTIDRHRDEIARAFRDKGYTVIVDYGLTDFKVDVVVIDPAQPERSVGILLDGVRWSKRKTVYSRDVLPVSILTGQMKWTHIARIWFPTWMVNREQEIQRIAALLR